MNCRPESRDSIRRFVATADGLERVVATDVLAPDASPTDTFEAEIVVEGAGFSPDLATEIGRAGLSVADVTTRGRPPHTVVLVRP
jgi:hypothetical protein